MVGSIPGNILFEDRTNSLSLKISLGQTERGTLSKWFKSSSDPSRESRHPFCIIRSPTQFLSFVCVCVCVRVHMMIDVLRGNLNKVCTNHTWELFEDAESDALSSPRHLRKSKSRTKPVIETIAECEGNWIDEVCFDGKSYWRRDTMPMMEMHSVNPSILLPSDSRLREDSFFIREGDMAKAQEAKLRIEELQRYDRKLRKEAANQREEKRLSY